LSIRETFEAINEIYLSYKNVKKEDFIANDSISEFRAFGFSETEKSFLIATTADLTIYAR